MPPSNRNWLSPAGIAHPSVRQFFNIKKNRTARRDGALVLEGLWAIRAALAAGVDIEVAFVCPELLRGDEAASLIDELSAGGVIALQVSGRVLGRMVERDGPDGVAAIASLRPAELSQVALGPTTRVVVADHLERVGNLGTIIRAADGAGASAVLAVSCHFRLTHPLVIKASMATVLSMPVVAVEQDEALAWLRQHRFRLVAADPTAEQSYRDVDFGDRVAIVVGNERRGLGQFWYEAADVRASIPMLGVADSLNVGHAAALLLYEALHQHRSSGRP